MRRELQSLVSALEPFKAWMQAVVDSNPLAATHMRARIAVPANYMEVLSAMATAEAALTPPENSAHPLQRAESALLAVTEAAARVAGELEAMRTEERTRTEQLRERLATVLQEQGLSQSPVAEAILAEVDHA